MPSWHVPKLPRFIRAKPVYAIAVGSASIAIVAIGLHMFRVPEPQRIAAIQANRNAAASLTCEGKFDRAEKQLQSTIAKSQRQLGTQNQETWKCQQALGVVYLNQSKFAEAEQRFRAALKAQAPTPGKDVNRNPAETARTHYLLALALSHQDKVTEAKDLSAQAYEEARASLGPDYPTTLLYGQLCKRLQEAP
jgi:tetratricopeptide (TPR) repeat protein